jgi:hypothetical protein
MMKIVRTRGIANAYRIIVVELNGKRPLGRPRRRWVSIAECGCMD